MGHSLIYDVANSMFFQVMTVPLLMLLLGGLFKFFALREDELPNLWIHWLVGIDLSFQGLAVFSGVFFKQLSLFPSMEKEALTNNGLALGACFILLLALIPLATYFQRSTSVERTRFYYSNGVGFLSLATALVLWRAL